METVTDASPLTELVATLEQATLMAKRLPNTTDPSQIIQIYSTLHSTHHSLALFLAHSSHPRLHPPQPFLPPPAADNSVSSTVGDSDEPMLVGDEEEEEEPEKNSGAIIDTVEARMRGCFIQNKRPKRRLSPASIAAAEEKRRRMPEQEEIVRAGFDPLGTRLRALDLIYQFHG